MKNNLLSIIFLLLSGILFSLTISIGDGEFLSSIYVLLLAVYWKE